MLGTKPGDCVPYFADFNRFTELLIDGQETRSPSVQALNANPRAITIVDEAESEVVMAVRTKQLYSIIQLKDLVRDYQLGGNFGHQIVSLIADLAWKHALIRKRYPAETPQGSDPAVKRAEDKLDQLVKGSRIFILEGVAQTDGMGNVIGVYGGQEKPNAGLLLGHTLHSDVGRPVGLWGDVGRRHHFGFFGADDDNSPSGGWWF